MNFLEVEDEQDDQSCNQFQHVQKTTVYDEELNHKEGYEESQWNVSLKLSNSEISCQEEGFFSLDFIKEKNDISFETFGSNQILNSDILNKVVDVLFGNCHELSLHGSFEK